MIFREGTQVRVLAATHKGARWSDGKLALDWPGELGDRTVYLDDARYGDYDAAPEMVYPVDVLMVEESHDL